jgi:hypothetical protein
VHRALRWISRRAKPATSSTFSLTVCFCQAPTEPISTGVASERKWGKQGSVALCPAGHLSDNVRIIGKKAPTIAAARQGRAASATGPND